LGSLGSAAAWTVALVINYNSSDTVDNAVYLTQNTGKWRIQSFGSYLSATFNGGSLIVTNNFNPGLNLLIFGQDSSNNAYLQLNNGPLATGSSYGFSAGGSPVLLGAYIGPNFPSYSQIVEVYGSTSAASASYFSSLYKAYSGNLALGSNYLLNKDSNTIGQWNAVDLFNSTARVGPVWTQLGTVPLNQISTTNNSTFSYSGGIITLYDAPLKTGIPGPYVYDTNTDNANISATITNIQTTISQTLNKGFKYNIVQVANPFQFPNSPGYVVFNFGQPNQLSLVPYVGSFTNQTGSGGFIILSPNYVFPIDVPSGSSVIYQGASSGFFVPNQPTLMSSTYLTDTPAGLAAAQDAVYDISAGGLGLIFNIMYGNSYGLGNWQYPSQNYYKITDAVRVNAENIEESVYDAQNPENFELIQSPT
jgi:hypothetical protein